MRGLCQTRTKEFGKSHLSRLNGYDKIINSERLNGTGAENVRRNRYRYREKKPELR